MGVFNRTPRLFYLGYYRMAGIYERERRDPCWLGGQLLFFYGNFSCSLKPQMRETPQHAERPNHRPISVEYFQAQHPSRAKQPRTFTSDSIKALVTP